MKWPRTYGVAAVLLWMAHLGRTDGFLFPLASRGRLTPTGVESLSTARHRSIRPHRSTIRQLACSSASNGLKDSSASAKLPTGVVEVVLFGLGDLRVDDNLGLFCALGDKNTGTMGSSTEQRDPTAVVPLCVLTRDMLSRFPGAVAHTADTAHLIAAALSGVDDRLRALVGAYKSDDGREQGQRKLNVCLVTEDEDENGTASSSLKSVLSQLQRQLGCERMRLHTCDLGDADNSIGYGAYSYAQRMALDDSDLPVEVIPWTNDLREDPWMGVEELPEQFPIYESKYGTIPPKSPLSAEDSFNSAAAGQLVTLDGFSLPTGEELEQILLKILDLDATRCVSERNTGLYASHWGGLDPQSVGEAAVLQTVRAYVTECGESDKAWFEHPSYVGRHVKRNGLSLEHAAMQWQLKGDGTSPAGNSDNWLPGESLVRFLAAPLLLGTISPRRLWYLSTPDNILFRSPLKQLVEGREWHRLLAARNLRLDPAYQGQGETTYKYWRYQGFLIRYAETEFSPSASTASSGNRRDGVLLVHGFGASGNQWNKVMHELRCASSDDDEAAFQGLAPDLIGFGQAEKPALSYTGYLWDSQTGDFVKEIAVQRNHWSSFVVGGNSIGGYTSMSAAASDAAGVGCRQLTSSGAPGTGLCSGLVLMNSAGPLLSRDEVAATQTSTANGVGDLRRQSVAQVTALNGLPPCRPPPRPVARIFGSMLLAYLRPRIQSICRNLYPTDPSAVDDALCGAILRDSLDPGAVYVMMAGAKLPPPRTSNELLQADFGGVPTSPDDSSALSESVFAGPVLVAQGVLDPLNDARDRMARFAALRPGVTAYPISAGHCPHDELPREVAGSVARWMEFTRPERWTIAAAASRASSSSAAAAR